MSSCPSPASGPLHTLESHCNLEVKLPLQQVVLQKQVPKGFCVLHSESSVGVDGLPGSQKRLVYLSPDIGSLVQAVTQVPGPDTPSRFTCSHSTALSLLFAILIMIKELFEMDEKRS